MRKEAVVTEVNSAGAVVRVAVDAACGTCTKCGGCGGKRQPAAVRLTLADAPALAPGDRVEAEVELPNLALVAAVVFGIPLALAVIGGVLGAWLFAQAGSAVAVGGALGLALGIVPVAVLDRTCAWLKPRGAFVRVLD